MWSDDADRVAYYAGYEGDRFWRAEVSGAPGIDELMPDILRELEADVREVREGGMAGDNIEMTETIQRMLDEMEGAGDAEIAAELAQSFNPRNIVDSADAYDNYGFVNWLWERVLEEKDITTIRTEDGAISFDPDIAEKYGEYFKVFEQREGRAARGAIRRLDDGRWLVGLFRNRDVSTIVHESGHFFMEQLAEAARLADAPEWVRDSWGKLQKAYGFEGRPTGEAWTRSQERFAADFEAYMREGKAPAHELRTAFEQFRDWLTSIYRALKDLLGDNELDPEVREVFDRLLATDEEIRLSRRAAEMAELPAGVYDAARMKVHGEPRQILLNAFELAVDDVADGRPVDVGRVGGLREAISRAAGAMGREDFAPDFTPEAPEVFTPAPERPAVNSGESPAAALMREQGIGPDGVSLEERMAAELEARGELDEDARAELLEARDAEEARRRIEEKGWEIMGCVMDAKE
jgi:hypothetical protein